MSSFLFWPNACRLVCIRHDQLIAPTSAPRLLHHLLLWRASENKTMVFICTLLGLQFGHTKNDDNASGSKLCFVYGSDSSCIELFLRYQLLCTSNGFQNWSRVLTRSFLVTRFLCLRFFRRTVLSSRIPICRLLMNRYQVAKVEVAGYVPRVSGRRHLSKRSLVAGSWGRRP